MSISDAWWVSGDPCHEFERVVIDRDGSDVMIRGFSKRERARECPTVLDEIEVTLRVSVPGGENTTFHFWQLGSTTLDTTATYLDARRRLEFIHLPPECTIRIYTISGNLVRVLTHTPDEGGTEVYDLLTRESRPIASGNYCYYVTNPGEKKVTGLCAGFSIYF